MLLSPSKRSLSRVLIGVLGVSYPFLVYFGLSIFSPLAIVAALISFLCLRVFFGIREKKPKIELIALGVSILCVLGLLLIDNLLAVKAYPVVLSLSLASGFAYSLFYPPCIIERFARMVEPNLNQRGVGYTRNVTWVWIGFFLINSSVSAWLALQGTLDSWTLYNGLISYILVAVVFGSEFCVRQFVKKYHVSET